MKIHQRGCGSPTGLGDVLAPRPCCKALRESKAQLKTCLTRCFLMDLPEWVNRLAACLEGPEKQQE